jgi:hypothetical protein
MGALPEENSLESTGFQWTGRKLAGAGFVILVLLTGVATAAYLMGRMAASDSATKPEKGAEQFIVVDPPPVKTAPTAKTSLPVPSPALAPSAQPRPNPDTQAAVPSPTAYLQVAALDRGMADVSVEYLKQRGFEARLGDGPTPGVFRVLVGPLEEPRIASTREALEKLGFRPFVKRN